MTIATLPSLRVLPVVELVPTSVNPHWHLFGYFPGTRDVYRLVHCYSYKDATNPPDGDEIEDSLLAGERLRFCTEMALVFGVSWDAMVDQFRAARGRPRRAKRAA